MAKDPEVTWIESDICVCDNCGAYASSPEKIEHFKTCQKGEFKKWEKFYSSSDEEEMGD